MSDRLLELIRAYADERVSADELQELQETLRASPEARARFLQELNVHAALDELALAASSSESRALASLEPSDSRDRTVVGATPRGLRLVLGTVALTLVVAIAAFLFRREPPSSIALVTVSGISGPVQWTGDGGVIRDDLVVGMGLPAGTVEGLSPKSWIEVRFDDGTKLTIAGRTRLVYSEVEHKALRLHSGQLFADVQPQSSGHPLLVTTPTATLEVVGTEFRVEADAYSTAMAVSEGLVRVERLSDGSVVDVDSGRRVVVAADHDFEVRPIPVTTDTWTSEIELGPDHSLGRWNPPTGDIPARLSSVPYTTEQKRVIHAIGVGVSQCDGNTVVLRPGTFLRMNGSVQSAHAIYFGISLRTRSGDFAGRFQTVLPKDRFGDGESFAVTLDISKFEFDPTLEHVRDRLPNDPFNLVVESVWSHTLWDPVGLTISKAELQIPEDVTK